VQRERADGTWERAALSPDARQDRNRGGVAPERAAKLPPAAPLDDPLLSDTENTGRNRA
jgi:hypothetical protein